MRPKVFRFLGIAGGAAAAVIALAVLVRPSPAAAQQPAPAAEAKLPPGYAGAEACKGCHEDQFTVFEKTRMGRLFLKQPRSAQEKLGCESCHGPGKAHADAGGGKGVGGLISFAKSDTTPVEKRNAVCLGCHTKGARLYWQGSAHESRDVACTSCHRLMTETSPKAQLAKATEIETCGTCHLQKRATTMRSSHMPLREGKMTCSSCHNPHGTVTPTLLREIGPNESCFTCHAEKRGPLLHTHPPVQESCGNCHDPHGSNQVKMLKVSVPRLCQQCHQPGPHGGSFQSGKGDQSTSRFVMGRGCLQCHQLIHGSNHPGGNFFTR